MGTGNVFSTYDPTSLFAGEFPVRHRPVNLAAGQNAAPVNGVATPLVRGTLLGRQSAKGVASAAGTNTGNGTLTLDATTPLQPNAQPGVYVVKFTAATTYNVFDPKGDELGQGANGAAFNDQIKFVTAAGGTAFVAGDTFNITVSNPDTYIVSVATATDGSQVPSAILAADTDTSGGAVMSPAYFEGEFAGEMMTIDASWSIATLQTALRQLGSSLYVRSVGTLG